MFVFNFYYIFIKICIKTFIKIFVLAYLLKFIKKLFLGLHNFGNMEQKYIYEICRKVKAVERHQTETQTYTMLVTFFSKNF